MSRLPKFVLEGLEQDYYDEHCDARDRIDTLLSEYFHALENVDIEPRNVDEMLASFGSLEVLLPKLKEMVEEADDLNNQFPVPYDGLPEPDFEED